MMKWRTWSFSRICIWSTTSPGIPLPITYLNMELYVAYNYRTKELADYMTLLQVTYSCDYLINCTKYPIQRYLPISIYLCRHKSSSTFRVLVFGIMSLGTRRLRSSLLANYYFLTRVHPVADTYRERLDRL